MARPLTDNEIRRRYGLPPDAAVRRATVGPDGRVVVHPDSFTLATTTPRLEWAAWDRPTVVAGGVARLTIQGTWVGEDNPVEVALKDGRDRTVGRATTRMYRSRVVVEVPVSREAEGAAAADVRLPDLGLSVTSGPLLVLPWIELSPRWEDDGAPAETAREGGVATLVVGVDARRDLLPNLEGAAVRLVVRVGDPPEPVVELRGTVRDREVRVDWRAGLPGARLDIARQAVLDLAGRPGGGAARGAAVPLRPPRPLVRGRAPRRRRRRSRPPLRRRAHALGRRPRGGRGGVGPHGLADVVGRLGRGPHAGRGREARPGYGPPRSGRGLGPARRGRGGRGRGGAARPARRRGRGGGRAGAGGAGVRGGGADGAALAPSAVAVRSVAMKCDHARRTLATNGQGSGRTTPVGYALRVCAVSILYALGVVSCQPAVSSTEAPPSTSAGPQVETSGRVASDERSEVACPVLEVIPSSLAAAQFGGEDAETSPALSAGAYAVWDSADGPVLYSLRPLIERAGGEVDLWLDPPDQDLSVIDMDFAFDVDPAYRREGTCGRIAVINNVESSTEEAFYVLDQSTNALALYDSLGRPVGALPRLGRPSPSSTAPLAPVPAGSLTFAADGPALTTGRGAADLRQVADYGAWYVRPEGVRYADSELVVVHVCDPSFSYSAESSDIVSEGPCGAGSGFNMDNPPPVKLETHFSARIEGDRVVLEPRLHDRRAEGAREVSLPLISREHTPR